MCRWLKSWVLDKLSGHSKVISVASSHSHPLSCPCFQMHPPDLLRWCQLHGSGLCNHQSLQTSPSRSPTSHLLHRLNKHPMLKPVTQKDALEADPALGKGGQSSLYLCLSRTHQWQPLGETTAMAA